MIVLVNKISNIQVRSYTPDVGKRRRVSRYQRGNQNPYIEEEQKTQWSKKKYKRTKDRVTQTPLKTGGKLMCS
jgi:hypothetical protein